MDKNFVFFTCTNNLFHKCHRSMDEMPTERTTDAESTEICCGCIQCMLFWPIGLVYDIFSSPCRYTYYKCKK